MPWCRNAGCAQTSLTVLLDLVLAWMRWDTHEQHEYASAGIPNAQMGDQCCRQRLTDGACEVSVRSLTRAAAWCRVVYTDALPVLQNSDRLAEQILQMEMSQSNIQTVAALQQAAAAGKANLKANDIEDVDLVLDEIAEQNDQMVQITDALGQSTIAGIDEDDLEAELNVRRPVPRALAALLAVEEPA